MGIAENLIIMKYISQNTRLAFHIINRDDEVILGLFISKLNFIKFYVD